MAYVVIQDRNGCTCDACKARSLGLSLKEYDSTRVREYDDMPVAERLGWRDQYYASRYRTMFRGRVRRGW